MARSKQFSDTLSTDFQTRSRERAKKFARIAEQERRPVARRNDLLPQLTIELRELTTLIAPEKRQRKFGLDDIIEAANVIAAQGFLQPIVLGRDDRIIDGELRFEAARWLQLEQVPCLVLSHLDRAEEKQVRIALNRLGQRREWDVEVLRTELEELIIAEKDIESLGLDTIELDQILIDPAVGGEEENVPEPEERSPVTRLGDLWVLGEHRLLAGDATKPESYRLLMGEERAQLLLTDAPYNVKVSSVVSTRHREFVQGSGEMSDSEFKAFLAAFIGCCSEVMVDGAIAFLFIDWRQLERMLRAGREAGFELLNIISWIKANGGMGSLYRSQKEEIPMFKKPGEHKNRIKFGAKGRNRTNCWFAPGAGTLGTDSRAMLKEHPTSKPVALLVDAIIDVTDPGDIVLDCFGGSGSTLVAAEKTRRAARLIELDCGYCDVILRRWMGFTGEEPVLEETGQSFSEVLEERNDEGEGDQLETLATP